MTDNGISINPNVTIPDAPKAARRFANGDEILGRYVVQAELGQGGMGVVYRCFDKIGGVEVAVKGLPPEVSHNSDEMEAVRENFQLVSELHHPNIAGVRTLEKDLTTGDYYLVMTLARGVSLRHWLRQHGGKEYRTEQFNVLRQIASALDYAHNAEPKHVIHRDVKPENIMVDDGGHVMVLDFGLAAQVRSSLSRVSQVVTSRSGTPAYKSPEQWLAQAQRAPSDQYSLGVIAYLMFAGELPFDSDDLEILKHAVVFDPVPEISGETNSINAAFAKVLAKKPQERFGTCEEFVRQLSETLRRPALFGSEANSPRNRKHWVLGVCSLFVVAGLLFVCCRPARKERLMATSLLHDACVAAGVSNVELACPSEKSGFARVVSNVDSNSVINLSATIRKRIEGDRSVEVKLQRVFDSVRVQTMELWLQSSHGSRVAKALVAAKNNVEAEGALLRIVGESNDGVEKALALCCININQQSLDIFYKSKESVKQDEYNDSLNFLNFKYAMALKDSSSDKEHRKAVEILLGIVFGRSNLSAPALYACSLLAFEEGKYREAASLLRRYIKFFSNGLYSNDALALLILCEFMDADSPCNKDIAASVRSKIVFSAYDSFSCKADISSLIQMYLSECPQGENRDTINKFLTSEQISPALNHADNVGKEMNCQTGFGQTNGNKYMQSDSKRVISDDGRSKKLFNGIDYAILLDCSGSMQRDGKLENACKDILRGISTLRSVDRFNIVTFHQEVAFKYKIWQPLNEETKNSTRTYLMRKRAHGIGDLNNALRSLFSMQLDSSRRTVAILITDAKDELTKEMDEKLSKFALDNAGKVEVFVCGIGPTVNRSLLERIAVDNGGQCVVSEVFESNAFEEILGRIKEH